MNDNKCFYCMKDSKLDSLMIEICKLNKSTVYLLREQSYKGRCVVAFDEHKTELFQLTEEELALYMKDVANVANAIYNVFSPDKINYATYGDLVPHSHVHLVPKYKDGMCWGKPFEDVNVDKKFLSEDQYKEFIDAIKEQLK
jgi:ATP adenylyltransferase